MMEQIDFSSTLIPTRQYERYAVTSMIQTDIILNGKTYIKKAVSTINAGIVRKEPRQPLMLVQS